MHSSVRGVVEGRVGKTLIKGTGAGARRRGIVGETGRVRKGGVSTRWLEPGTKTLVERFYARDDFDWPSAAGER